jgi:hypothetical protein
MVFYLLCRHLQSVIVKRMMVNYSRQDPPMIGELRAFIIIKYRTTQSTITTRHIISHCLCGQAQKLFSPNVQKHSLRNDNLLMTACPIIDIRITLYFNSRSALNVTKNKGTQLISLRFPFTDDRIENLNGQSMKPDMTTANDIPCCSFLACDAACRLPS